MEKEIRRYPMEVRDVDKAKGTFTAYATVFNKVCPWYNEVILPGAFTKTLSEGKANCPILQNHWSDIQIGRGLTAVEDAYGLLVEGELVMEVQAAREQWALCEQGLRLKAPQGVSIGFETVKAMTDNESGLRSLMEIKLWEYSICPFPAYEDAQVIGLRSVVDVLHRRHIITDEQRDMALAIKRAADIQLEPELHSIADALDRAVRGLCA